MGDSANSPQPSAADKGVAVVNGKALRLDQARLPVDDRGFLFGHAVFETILVLQGRVIAWNDHMARLARGCDRVHIRMPDVRLLRNQLREAVALNTKETGALARKVSVRLIVTGGSSTTLAVPRGEDGTPNEPNVVILCKDAPGTSASLMKKGVALATFGEARTMPLVDVKSTNYLWNLLALEHARAKGADDAVFVTSDGYLSECTTANFVWVNADRLVCAMPNKDHCLPGTTLQALSRALRKHEHMINEAPLHVSDLGAAACCLALSSVRGLVPVKSIDGHTFDLENSAELVEYLNGVLDEELALSAVEI